MLYNFMSLIKEQLQLMTSIPSTSFSSLPHFPSKLTGLWINVLSSYLGFFSSL